MRKILHCIAALLTVFVLLCFFGCSKILDGDGSYHTGNGSIQTATPIVDGENLEVYFIDVGQGDSILMVAPSGKTMLVDSGTAGSFTKISLLLESLGIDKLDAAVATHPHADHIGSMGRLVNEYQIKQFYMPDVESDSDLFIDMQHTLKSNQVNVNKIAAEDDTRIIWDENVNIQVFSPDPSVDYGEDYNKWSIIMKVSYGDTSLMLTGDAGTSNEYDAVARFGEKAMDCDVLKVGHHGSGTSTSRMFADAVSPEYAVISCGADNQYGHPNSEVLDMFDELGIKVLRTDTMGTIHISFTGDDVLLCKD